MTDPQWESRTLPLVVVGSGTGQRQRLLGLLTGFITDRKYKNKDNYRLILHTGEEVELVGNAALKARLGEDDLGKFVKIEFKGWAERSGNRYKIIQVDVLEAPNAALREKCGPLVKAWEDTQRRLAAGPMRRALPPGDDYELVQDDDLPPGV